MLDEILVYINFYQRTKFIAKFLKFFTLNFIFEVCSFKNFKNFKNN